MTHETIQLDSIEDALLDLKQGKVIIVVDDEDRENEGDFVALAELATPETINFMIREGRGLVCAPIGQDRADALGLRQMAHHNSDAHGTAFTVSVDHCGTTTGISAGDRSRTIMALCDPAARAEHFRRPGHIFPLTAKPGGVLERPGHTEAAVDLAKLCGAIPAGVICEIINRDGTMARLPQLAALAQVHGLKLISIQDLIRYRKRHDKLVKREAVIKLPTDYGDFTMIGYSSALDGKEHLALVKGEIDGASPVLVRIHSECLTGDVFHSRRCDCGEQLEAAMRQLELAGSGILLYMRQEGRGIGLLNKLRAYALQEQGLDTVEANAVLGFGADERDYAAAAQMLRDLGVSEVRLMTNNPAKMQALSEHGIQLTERVPHQIPANESNRGYLETKRHKMGHLFAAPSVTAQPIWTMGD